MYRSLSTALFLALSSRSSVVSAQTTLSLVPAPKSSNAAVCSPLDPSFAGFGIEPSNLFSFTGGDDANELSVQLMQNLADYAGAPPHIRLGGNTQDYMVYDDSYTDMAWKNNPDSTAQGAIAADSMIIGPGYFKAIDRFPKGTPVTYGLNMAYEGTDYKDKIVKEAQAAVDGMTNVKLYSFEVGNEPDLWLQNGFRSGAWSGATYAEEFLARADAVYQQVLKPAGISAQFFEPPATASTIGTTFEIAMLVQDGMMNETNGNVYAARWNQHDYFYFIDVTTGGLTLDDLMDLDGTNTQFAYWEDQVKIGLATGLPYVLREMSSVGPIGMHGVSDAFGAALWTLNFFCYTASLNISSVQMHMTDNSNASAWQPIAMYGNDPFVRPQYYAHAAMAQLIGNGNGTTQIAVLNTDDVDSSYKGRIRAFAAYANSNVQAMVLINSKQANASETTKSSFTFTVDFGTDNKNTNVYLSLLTADGADSLSGTTFNGMQFADSSGKMSYTSDAINSTKTDGSGKASIQVRDSQAVIANLKWVLGSNAVLGSSTSSEPRKTSTAGPSKTGAGTAVLTGVATTTLALASSISGSGDVSETGRTSEAAAKEGKGVRWRTLGVCLVAVAVGMVYMA